MDYGIVYINFISLWFSTEAIKNHSKRNYKLLSQVYHEWDFGCIDYFDIILIKLECQRIHFSVCPVKCIHGFVVLCLLILYFHFAWWRHQMETFSASLAICVGNSPQKPVTRSFDVFFDMRLNERLSKQSRGWWFETLSRPLWHHWNGDRLLSSIYLYQSWFLPGTEATIWLSLEWSVKKLATKHDETRKKVNPMHKYYNVLYILNVLASTQIIYRNIEVNCI